MFNNIRVLLILPLYGGSLPIGKFCAAALQSLGILVDTFDAPSFYSAFTALKNLKVNSNKLEYLENSFLQVMSQAVLAKVETFEPDLVLSMAQAPLTRQALKKMAKDKILTAMWFVEDHNLFTYWQAFAPYYDFFAVIQKEPFLSKLKESGVDNALYLPLACLPDFHKPQDLSVIDKKRYGADISFMGAGYINRRLAFRKLTHFDFKIWGTEWEDDHILAKHVQLSGTRITPEQSIKIYNAGKINLNLHSSASANKLIPQADFINPRTFELAACSAFQLVDKRSLLPELFTANELVTFKSIEELLDIIPYYLNNQDLRQDIARKSRKRALKDHSYQQRMLTLLNFIQERCPDFNRKKNDLPPDNNLPLSLQLEIQKLQKDLNLASRPLFNDLVMAIRQRQGKLNEMETVVLFLDEWRKQYTK